MKLANESPLPQEPASDSMEYCGRSRASTMLRSQGATTRYIGQCIYCGSRNGLSDEHVVPYGLAGPWKLKKASCHDCSSITAAFEQDVLRGQFDLGRSALGMPSRRKSQRPQEFEFVVGRTGVTRTVKLPVAKCPALFIMPHLKRPRYIDNYEYKAGFMLTGASLHGPAWDRVKESLGEEFSVTQSTSASFPRLLAKIAYGMAVLQYGLNAFGETYVLPCILGEKDDVGFWVGCPQEPALIRPKESAMHRIELSERGQELSSLVRLFANFETPDYLVIIGTLKASR